MDLTQLRYFQAVARTGNITRAASELYVTQPNLSKEHFQAGGRSWASPSSTTGRGKIELNDYGRMFSPVWTSPLPS